MANGTVDKSTRAEAASAHSRINIPVNLQNWKGLDAAVQEQLLWFHQHILDEQMSWTDVAEATGYDQSSVFRWLKGTYQGSWPNVRKAIAAYHRISDKRGTIQDNRIVPNSITRLIGAGLDYALANNSITKITGESRMGKTEAATMWRNANNHGTSVFVTAPAYGGTKMFMRRIAAAVGVNKNISIASMCESLERAFNRNRILIVDEAHRLLPGRRAVNPQNLEILRDLHDQTHCGLALLATERFDDELQKANYMFEQILGRIGMPIRLPRKIKRADWMPITRQYIEDPSDELRKEFDRIANRCGRLGIMVEVLKVASRIAAKAKEALAEEHIWKAIALRRQMMGEVLDNG